MDNTNKENTHKVFAYGTLRVGQGNYSYLLKDEPGVKYLGEDTIEGFTMIHLGGFPALIENNFVEDFAEIRVATKVVGDVFEVNDETMTNLDALEGYPTFYNRKEVETENNGTCWVYYHENLSKDTLERYMGNIIYFNNWLEVS